MVPILSSSEKLKIRWGYTLGLFGSGTESSTGSRVTDIILEGRKPILPGAAKISFIVPMGGFKEVSLQGSWFAWPWWPLERCKRCLSFLSWTSWSRWFQRFLQSSIVCPWSWWYWQYRLWLCFMEFLAILFGHLKNGSFLIFSKTWCTSSLNTALTFCVLVDPYCPAKSLLGLLLLYQSDLKFLHFWRITLSFPFLVASPLPLFCICQSSPLADVH